MDQLLKQKKTGKSRILVAPLDWGLGHATRCIPIIRELVLQNSDVWLAGEGPQKELLRSEFPGLPFIDLPGYRVHYAKTKKGLAWQMIRQAPKIRKAILYEHQWLRKAVKEYHIDAVISDNRYGLHHPEIPSFFITHQLRIKSSAGSWTEKILQKRNYRYINRFTECWVPDEEGEKNLAGSLSHPAKKPGIPVRYTGLLSRFPKSSDKPETGEKKGHLLVLLSGPEPQRSILEDKILKEIAHYNGTAAIVRGLPGSASVVPSGNMIRIYNHLTAAELNEEIKQAEYIISRSGYSTIMDIVQVQKKSILIPTPGQTEQEYLGEYLMEKGIALLRNQRKFSLQEALRAASAFDYKIPFFINTNMLSAAVSSLLDQSLARPDLG